MSIASASDGWTTIRENREEIIERWSKVAGQSLGGRITQTELKRDVREMFEALADAPHVEDHDLTDSAFSDLRALLADVARTRVRQGFSPTETAIGVFAVKQAVLELLESQGDLASYKFFAEFSRFVDDLGLYMLDTYAQTRESVIAGQTEALLELSTPVVKLWEGIVALPLVGILDSARTQVAMETLLKTLVSTGSEHAIIDITGVSAVDTQVAQNLLKTVRAARLLGTECIISGIRPQIAQTMVGLGIEFGDVSTKASLADALLLALRRSGNDVVKRQRA
ncbi:STAS domain-containing protein [Nocardioides mesophilus]|uniref:STAS domain-containing protein n=1 Tax=Nocardioides mesophilus TaxID=433659 RepID=A0A7G9RCH6_9ACTN|nr:STAS domain-containing protein [Nocardioides mesophilus]QNN53301.1 STAS domain-containing protein [Nocardioides mesophilus]